MSEPQIEPQSVQGGVGVGQSSRSWLATATLSAVKMLRHVQCGAEQACGDRVPVAARESLASGDKPLQQVEHAGKDHHVFHDFGFLPGNI